MALVLADRVRETTTTTGTGAVTLGGAYTGFQTFSAAIGNANNTYYTIANVATNEWEVGIGTYTSSTNTLSRDTVLASSNSGSLVSFVAGTKDVFVTQPAERAVYVSGTDVIAANNASVKTTYGGTGLTSYTAGDLPYYATGTALSKLGIGAANTILTSSGTAPQWSTALTVTGLTDSGNLTFTGTGNRITGDFSNATVANRVLFQTSTTNSNTLVGVIPAGTATVGQFGVFNSSDPANAAFFNLLINSTDARLTTNAAGTGTALPMTFYTGGSERMRIDTSGNVGIGLTPTASVGALQVSGSVFATSTHYVGAAGSTAFSGGIQNLSNISKSISIEADPTNVGASSLIYFNIDGSTKMAIDSSGNVGIGTSAPGVRLNVTDSQNTGTGLVVNNPNTGASAYSSIRTSSNDGNIWIVNGSTANGGNPVIYSDNATGVFALKTFNALPLVFGTSNTERMRIDTSGNVGIGTSSPGAKLDIISSGLPFRLAASSSSGYALAQFGQSATATQNWHIGSEGDGSFRFYNGNYGAGLVKMLIDSSGNVGIGTSSPEAQLHVKNSSGNSISILGQYGIGTKAQIAAYANQMDIRAYNGTNDVMTFTTGASERMRIDSSGNVGIGTSSPTYKTQINSNGNQLLIDNSGGGQFSNINLGNAGVSKGNWYWDQVNTYMVFGTDVSAPLLIKTNTVERMRIDTSGNVLVTNVAGLGYGTGSGGTVTQATSKSTTVTLNKPTGQITMNNATLAAGARVSFVCNNSLVSSTDTVILNLGGGSSNPDDYLIRARMFSGGFTTSVINQGAVGLTEAIVINFAIIKGATS